ncbi:MAG: DUF58 domain-containing protein [Ardenticatenaceae bacterium]
MLKEYWPILAFLLALLGLLFGQPALLLMASLFFTTMLVALLWNHWSLRNMSYTRTFDEERVFVGETVGLTLELVNRKPLPLSWLEVDDRFPENMPPEGRKLRISGIPEVGLLSNIATLSWYQKVRWRYQIPCQQRGYYFFGSVFLRSGDIFGIFESEVVQDERTRLIVYPKVEPLERLGLPAKNPFGGRRTPLPVFEDPTRVVGVRDYHPDDPMRRVHWKATARTQALQVRVWEPTQEPQLMVFLNVATMEKHWLGVKRELLEWTISVAASICQHAFDDKNAIGLIANASIPRSDQPVKVASGRSPHQMRHILEALAAITSYPTSTIQRLLYAESPKMEWGATLVVVTAVVSEALLAQILRLRRAGRQLALVSLDNSFAEEKAELVRAQGIVVHRLPAHRGNDG